MACAVLQTTLTPPDLDRLERAFRHVPGLAAPDAYIIGRDAYGVLVKDFSPERALALQAALRAEGVETEIVDMEALPPVPPAKHVRRLDITPEHLVIYDPLGRQFPLPWQHVTMISAGIVKMIEFAKRSKLQFDVTPDGTALRAGMVTTEERHLRFIGDVTVAGGGLRYTFVADEFNFATLGERRTRQTFANMILLLQEIARCAPHAVLNLGAQAAQDKETVRYPSKSAFLEEIVWRLFQLKRTR